MLYLCSVPEEQLGKVRYPKLLVRFFGNAGGVLLDRKREREVSVEVATLGLSPAIVAEFPTGRIEEYIADSRTITGRERETAPLVARALAKLHLTAVSGDSTQPAMHRRLRQWRTAAAEPYEWGAATERVAALRLPAVCAEIETLLRWLDSLQSPVVFCHNDLTGGNVLQHGSPPRVTFIDFEYAEYNPRAWDIGNYFCEFGGLQCDYSLFPDEATQRSFVEEYLRAYDGAQPSTDAVDALLAEIPPFVCASHAAWGLWASVMARGASDVEFDYVEYARKRLDAFWHTYAARSKD